MGAVTTYIAVYEHGAILHTASLKISCYHFTNDNAHKLRTPNPEAYHINERYACSMAQLATTEQSI
ncbi:cell division FtsA domain-containing protein, partial [Stenotrophomonas maltophilia]|uniref:cell division FtsA domain-containing protein n=1 Tax=Stenotrophomonas maltophilia TaxID=40324 RepID=UPI003CCFF534